MAKKKKKKASKEEVCEVFEVEKGKGKEQVKKVCGTIEKKHATKKDLKKQNKTLRNILIGLIIVVLLILGLIYIFNSANNFTYRGVSGKVVKEGDIIFYQTSFPVMHQGREAIYNVYIRNDPRKLDKIPFEGGMDFAERFDDGYYRLVLNISDDFDCNGDEIISIANMMNLKAVGIKVGVDPGATCDSLGRYMFANIKKGEESKITQIEDSCYELSVKECDILKVTERFMVETFVKYSE